MQSVKVSCSTKLGGGPSIRNISEWMKSVSSNPVVLSSTVKGIVHLLNGKQFPDDPLIRNEDQLISMAT
ncbi:unnamed protein product [Rotaria sp. Silwood1]|nr:unnamed protein product [Rotaria sp. Silwood1]